MSALLRTKTFWTGVSVLALSLGAYFAGEMSLADTLQSAATALIGIFLRQGMLK
jgi:hypothetical protein